MIITLLASFCVTAFSQEWNYDNPNDWQNSFEQCGGDRQSPIDINCQNTVWKSLRCINFDDYFDEIEELECLNLNGKTIECIPPESAGITISGGELIGTYALQQFHFHWGRDNTEGSEHTFKNVRYPLELHLVHANADGQLVVVAVIYQLCYTSNDAIETITDNIDSILYPNQTEVIEFDNSLSELLPINYCSYYQYSGSLTTPPCTEGVTWIVLRNRQCITRSQMENFRQVFASSNERLTRNFRPTQPLGDRKVLTNKPCYF